MLGTETQRPAEKTEPAIPCLAMRTKQAAAALGISERLLWELTQRGVIPCVRLNKAVLYSTDALRDWLRTQTVSAEKKSEK
jgi:excisionase family DNA binding protein